MKHTEKYLQAKWVTENPKGYDERDVARANSYCEAYLEGYNQALSIANVVGQSDNKMDYKDEAQRLINYSMNLLSIQYNSDGVVMNRRECLPKARMIARSHISFLINQGNFAPHMYDYWKKVEEELDMCL